MLGQVCGASGTGLPWDSHAPVRLQRCNGTVNRAALCIADDFFDVIEDVLATKGLAYRVQEPFDNALEPKAPQTQMVFITAQVNKARKTMGS